MTRYVVLHKLSRGFKEWEYRGSYVTSSRETVPIMTDEFRDWHRENHYQIKAVHTQRMVESDRTEIAFEFYNTDDALLCMLTFS